MESGNTRHTIEWRIIAAKLDGEPLTPEEELQFSKWLAASPQHRTYYNKAFQAHNSPDQSPPEININRLFADFDRAAGLTTPRRSRLSTLTAIAASLAIALVSVAVWLIIGHNGENVATEESHVAQQPILPASTRACLILPDGNTLEINADTRKTLSSEAIGGYLHIADGNVTCSGPNESVYSQESSTTIAVPRGGMYGLTLSDGTKVWLNANTCLSFPTIFKGDTRTVRLDGEAYFEVTSNAHKPFIVETFLSDIRVYGTKFNVRSYTRDRSQQLTLLSGSIGVEYEGVTHMLTPGQQARIATGSEQVRITDVNPQTSCSWTEGLFVFENMPLHEILTQLSDWYDVDFIYTDTSLRHLHFTGDLERYSDFAEILSLIEMTTSVRFITDGRVVKVTPKS